MAKDGKKDETDTNAMQVAFNEVVEALKPMSDEARLRALASAATFLGIGDQLMRRLRS